jgi:hypothetical protein
MFEQPNPSLNFKDLVNTRFVIEVGSGDRSGVWGEKELIKIIKEAIKHNLFDYDFYYNWTNSKKEYSAIFYKDTTCPLLKNIDKTLSELFLFKDGKLTFKIQDDEAIKWIDKWFQTNKSISESLKKDYQDYRYENCNYYWDYKYENY